MLEKHIQFSAKKGGLIYLCPLQFVASSPFGALLPTAPCFGWEEEKRRERQNVENEKGLCGAVGECK
jgi:hypothetical protein